MITCNGREVVPNYYIRSDYVHIYTGEPLDQEQASDSYVHSKDISFEELRRRIVKQFRDLGITLDRSILSICFNNAQFKCMLNAKEVHNKFNYMNFDILSNDKYLDLLFNTTTKKDVSKHIKDKQDEGQLSIF